MYAPYDLLDVLEKAIFTASASIPDRRPWVPAQREALIAAAKQCLGIRDAWMPRIDAVCVGQTVCGKVTVHKLCATSWPGCYTAAHLYMPGEPSQALPLVLLCCGHGEGGKQATVYQLMAWRLAHMGSAVLVPDNIGQGERTPMGHSDVVAPFQCGLSLQGLIVMETMAWLQWALADGRFDPARFAAIGNSGGGTLSLFLAAFCRDALAVLSSSGYPSTFEFMARKEKKHCHCNILPGVVGTVEMWQLLGCFAPKPMFLFQGKNDHLIPEDLFYVICRKVGDTYQHCGAAAAFRAEVFPGEHSWDDLRREALAAYLAKTLHLNPTQPHDTLTDPPGNCYAAWPADALTTDALACRITGVSARPDDSLVQVYCPELIACPDRTLRRVGHHQLAAQMAAFLAPSCRPR